MFVTKIQLLSGEDVISRLLKVRLKGHGQELVYSDVRLGGLVEGRYLLPAQNYVLASKMKLITELHHQILAMGVDIFDMAGLLFWLRGQDQPIPLLPPIVEYDNMSLTIADGMHRVACSEKTRVYVCKARFPYYAYPLPNWTRVQCLDRLPKGFIKKTYREPLDHTALFRDYNAQFPGIQEKR